MIQFQPDELILHDYIQGHLNSADEEKVELWLAENPEALKDLQLDIMMKQGISQRGFAPDISVNPTTSGFSLTTPALVFSLIICFVSGFILSDYFRNQTDKNLLAPAVIMLSQVRGESDVPLISSKQGVLIQVPVGYLSNDIFSVEIQAKKGKVFEIQNLSPVEDIISVYIKEKVLTDGDYQLHLINLNTREQENYSFAVKNG